MCSLIDPMPLLEQRERRASYSRISSKEAPQRWADEPQSTKDLVTALHNLVTQVQVGGATNGSGTASSDWRGKIRKISLAIDLVPLPSSSSNSA